MTSISEDVRYAIVRQAGRLTHEQEKAFGRVDTQSLQLSYGRLSVPQGDGFIDLLHTDRKHRRNDRGEALVGQRVVAAVIAGGENRGKVVAKIEAADAITIAKTGLQGAIERWEKTHLSRYAPERYSWLGNLAFSYGARTAIDLAVDRINMFQAMLYLALLDTQHDRPVVVDCYTHDRQCLSELMKLHTAPNEQDQALFSILPQQTSTSSGIEQLRLEAPSALAVEQAIRAIPDPLQALASALGDVM